MVYSLMQLQVITHIERRGLFCVPVHSYLRLDGLLYMFYQTPVLLLHLPMIEHVRHRIALMTRTMPVYCTRRTVRIQQQCPASSCILFYLVVNLHRKYLEPFFKLSILGVYSFEFPLKFPHISALLFLNES